MLPYNFAGRVAIHLFGACIPAGDCSLQVSLKIASSEDSTIAPTFLCFFGLSAFGLRKQQPDDTQRLEDDQRDRSNNAPLVQLPNRKLFVANNAPGRNLSFRLCPSDAVVANQTW